MHAMIKTVVLSAAVAAATLTSIAPASAGDYYRHHRRDGIALGAAGLAAGVLLGTALADRPRYVEEGPVYVEPDDDYLPPPPPPRVYSAPTRVYVEDQPVYVQRDLRPWSPAWRRYCSQRYRSFDPGTGTYVGYDGRERFCTAG